MHADCLFMLQEPAKRLPHLSDQSNVLLETLPYALFKAEAGPRSLGLNELRVVH